MHFYKRVNTLECVKSIDFECLHPRLSIRIGSQSAVLMNEGKNSIFTGSDIAAL